MIDIVLFLKKSLGSLAPVRFLKIPFWAWFSGALIFFKSLYMTWWAWVARLVGYTTLYWRRWKKRKAKLPPPD